MSMFDGVPPYNGNNTTTWIHKARTTINNLLNGKSNNTGSFTLATSTATTVVTLAQGRMGPDTVILYQPLSLNAAAEIGAGTMFVSSKDVETGVFRLTHASNTQNDRNFAFILVG